MGITQDDLLRSQAHSGFPEARTVNHEVSMILSLKSSLVSSARLIPETASRMDPEVQQKPTPVVFESEYELGDLSLLLGICLRLSLPSFCPGQAAPGTHLSLVHISFTPDYRF